MNKLDKTQLSQEQQEWYLNYQKQQGQVEATNYLLGIHRANKSTDTLLGLVPLFYNLAISSLGIDIAYRSLGETLGKEKKHNVQLLGRRGLIVVKITDKYLEETYHPKSELKNIKLFVKRNNKWRLDKENYFGIKTGAYKLNRIYRYRKPKEVKVETCPKCGKPLEDCYDD